MLGAFADADLIDEFHVFIAPKLAGGEAGMSPLGGAGRDLIPDAADLAHVTVDSLDGDVYIHGVRNRE